MKNILCEFAMKHACSGKCLTHDHPLTDGPILIGETCPQPSGLTKLSQMGKLGKQLGFIGRGIPPAMPRAHLKLVMSRSSRLLHSSSRLLITQPTRHRGSISFGMCKRITRACKECASCRSSEVNSRALLTNSKFPCLGTGVLGKIW